MSRTLVTARLRLEPVTPEHLPHLIELNADDAVMRLILGRAATVAETTAEWRQRLAHQSAPDRGLGYWAGFEADAFVGWWSASAFEDDATTAGLGYRLLRAAWGRGLATEGARRMLDKAFGCSDVRRVVASTMAVNLDSRSVLSKVGLRHVRSWHEARSEPIPGSEHGEVLYELTRAEHLDSARRPAH